MLILVILDLVIIAMHGHTSFIFKADIWHTYMSIHHRRIMASLFYIDSSFIRYLCIFIHWDHDGDIWLFTKFKFDDFWQFDFFWKFKFDVLVVELLF